MHSQGAAQGVKGEVCCHTLLRCVAVQYAMNADSSADGYSRDASHVQVRCTRGPLPSNWGGVLELAGVHEPRWLHLDPGSAHESSD